MDAAEWARTLFREVETLEARLVEVLEARRAALEALVAEGYRQREIASMVGVSQPRISQILNAR